MTPKQIADHLVERGIGEKRRAFDNSENHYAPPGAVRCPAEQFITDWRVAGKCLEAMHLSKLSLSINDTEWRALLTKVHEPRGVARNESLPQAICTAYCEATHE